MFFHPFLSFFFIHLPMHPISKCAANCICNGNAFLMNGIHWIFIWWNFHLLCTHTHVQGAGGKRDSISNERCKKLCIYLYKTHIHVSTSIQIDYIFFVFMSECVVVTFALLYSKGVLFNFVCFVVMYFETVRVMPNKI